MDQNQPIDQFDAMLRQSLEGAKMQVPAGAWEAVGSSIGAKAIVAAKIAGIKLLVVKSVAALLIAGGTVWGIYKLVEESKDTKVKMEANESSVQNSEIIKDNPSVSNSELTVAPDESQSTEGQKEVSKKLATGEFSVSQGELPPNRTQVDTSKPAVRTKHSIVTSEPKPKEADVKKDNTPGENKKDIVKTDPKEEKLEPVNSSAVVDIPNVFTPYDIDGYNDCYKIVIENEVKFALQIFDANGNKVFETMDKNNCWDGKNFNTQQMCAKGFYTYKLSYELRTGYKKTERGGLNLL